MLRDGPSHMSWVSLGITMLPLGQPTESEEIFKITLNEPAYRNMLHLRSIKCTVAAELFFPQLRALTEMV